MRLSKLQKLNPSAIGKYRVRNGPWSAFGNWKMKKMVVLRHLMNTIVPWPMPVRQSLRNLQRRGAFNGAFKVKMKMTPQSAIGN
jgi:hypothetical protein